MCGALFALLSSVLPAVTVTDFEGRTVTIAARPQRIISLAAIATKILVQCDLMDKVVGMDERSKVMELLPVLYPALLPKITDLGNAKSVNEEAIRRLRPDIVITQYDKATADRLSARIGVPVLCIQNRPGMDYELYEILGKVLFVEPRANEIVAYMKDFISRIEKSVSENRPTSMPKVYVATDGSLLNTFPKDPDLILCEGINAAAEITTMNYWGGATVDVEFIVRAKPDIIVVWMPFDAPQELSRLKETIKRREFANIPAIKNNRVYTTINTTYGKDYFYAMVWTAETMSRLYPDRYSAQILEQDVKALLAVFYPMLPYPEYKKLREKITISR
jgi:iron complex transport system substrate-binding protein